MASSIVWGMSTLSFEGVKPFSKVSWIDLRTLLRSADDGATRACADGVDAVIVIFIAKEQTIFLTFQDLFDAGRARAPGLSARLVCAPRLRPAPTSRRPGYDP